MGSNSERRPLDRGYTRRGAPRDLIVLIKSPLHSLRVQSWTAICLLIFFPDKSKDGVGDDAYERRNDQYRQELTHDVALRMHSLDLFRKSAAVNNL